MPLSNPKLRNTLRLSDEDWTHIQTILHKGTPEQREIARRIEVARTITDREQLYIDGAEQPNIVCEGELQVDRDAIVSEVDTKPKGAFVQAWLWVRNDAAGVFDVDDRVTVAPSSTSGEEHPTITHEFSAVVKAVKKDTDGSTYYTVIDQEDNALDVEGKFLILYED